LCFMAFMPPSQEAPQRAAPAFFLTSISPLRRAKCLRPAAGAYLLEEKYSRLYF
jgi:hypothetical protein